MLPSIVVLAAVVVPPSEAGVVAAEPAPPPAGIGASMKADIHAGLPGVHLPVPGSPAAKAGLRAGDLVATVDGWSTKGEALQAVIQHIGGPPGTEVTLGVVRDGRAFDLRVRREAIRELAEAQLRREKELCPALWAAIADRQGAFSTLKGAELPSGGESDTAAHYTATTALPTAEYTHVDYGLSRVWTAGFGTYTSPAEAARTLDEVVARFGPCFGNSWLVRETEENRPVVYFGFEHPVGWFSTIGAFRARQDGVVDLYVESGELQLNNAILSGPASGPWVDTLRKVTAAAANRFEALRTGEVHVEGSPFNPARWYDTSAPLPGARDCRVNDADMFNGPYYQCTLAANTAPETVGPSFDQAAEVVSRSLGEDWVYWHDPKPAAHGRHFVHFARRTSRGYEKTAVVTLGLSETGITISVSYDGII